MQYPEHEKLHAIKDRSQEVGEFLEWLGHTYSICEFDEGTAHYWPAHRPIASYLAEYFNIDQEKIDAEKRAMLDAIRASH